MALLFAAAAAASVGTLLLRSKPTRSMKQFRPQEGEVDVLFHLGASSDGEVVKAFADTKFVLMGGSKNRIRKLASEVGRKLGIEAPLGGYAFAPVFANTDRYVVYKVGPVVCVSHGIGIPSMSVMLHEMAKLMRHAKASNYIFIRIGTCGGIGLPVGTVALSSASVNHNLEAVTYMPVAGRVLTRPSHFDAKLVASAQATLATKEGLPQLSVGKTLTTNDFYEGQGRTDGAWTTISHEDTLGWLRSMHAKGVQNIEMESSGLASFCNAAGIPALMFAAVIINRLEGDQIKSSPEVLHAAEQGAIDTVLTLVEEWLHKAP